MPSGRSGGRGSSERRGALLPPPEPLQLPAAPCIRFPAGQPLGQFRAPRREADDRGIDDGDGLEEMALVDARRVPAEGSHKRQQRRRSSGRIPGDRSDNSYYSGCRNHQYQQVCTNDNFACYAGLGMKEHSTGNNAKLVPSRMYNRRLKDAFITADKNFVRCNPESHLAGYYKNLVKGGMSFTEARKRVARALVRVIFMRLLALIEEESYLQMGGG